MVSPNDIALQKQELRQKMLAQRNAIPEAERALAADSFLQLFFEGFDLSERRCIAGYFPIGSECDGRPLYHNLRSLGHDLALPVVLKNESPLVFRLWSQGGPLAPGTFNIPEPSAKAAVVSPDLVFVPLLAFDRTGQRLGYGKGFYDRTLDILRAQKDVIAIGMGYSFQEVEAVPHNRFDSALDFIITPQSFIKVA